jgi:hypothetical protein
MARLHSSPAAKFLIAGVLAACGSSDASPGANAGGDVGSVGPSGENGALGNGGQGSSQGSSQPPPGDGGRGAYCAGKGPPVTVGDDGQAAGGTSSACIAAWTFRSAVCACDNIEVTKKTGSSPGYFRTDSFSSTSGPYASATAGTAGRVGCNSTYNVHVDADIGGELALTSETALFQQFATRVRGELRTSGGVLVNTPGGSLEVDQDAWVLELLAVDTDMAVHGTLYRGDGAVTIGAGSIKSKSTVKQSFNVTPPCACGPQDLLDIAGYVRAAKANNHDADVGLAPGALASYGADASFDLPCGRFYLDGVRVPDHALTLRIHGRTALLVDGPLIAGSLKVDLDPDAELDLFVADNFIVSGKVELGSMQHPAASRLYVGGTGNVVLQGQQVFVGNVYAPRATIVTDPELEVYGALFANVVVGQRLAVHYDAAVQKVGEGCGDAPPPPPSQPH